jgi:hypothetical protein
MQDDMRLDGYNIEEKIETFVSQCRDQAKAYKTNNIMLTMGSDFCYQNANTWYKSLDKLIHYAQQDGRVNAFYSTPTEFTDLKFAAGAYVRVYSVIFSAVTCTNSSSLSRVFVYVQMWSGPPKRTTGFLMQTHHTPSGPATLRRDRASKGTYVYFMAYHWVRTCRPTYTLCGIYIHLYISRYVKTGSNMLQSCRQLEAQTFQPDSKVGSQTLWEAMGVAQVCLKCVCVCVCVCGCNVHNNIPQLFFLCLLAPRCGQWHQQTARGR